jgi:hypothetical protein
MLIVKENDQSIFIILINICFLFLLKYNNIKLYINIKIYKFLYIENFTIKIRHVEVLDFLNYICVLTLKML